MSGKKKINSLLGINMHEEDINKLLHRFLIILSVVSAIIIFALIFGCGNFWDSITTFLLVGSACLMSGWLLGFVFGLPKSGKYRYSKDGDQENKPWYFDNTNLEEVSDWLTKIIVGISLVQFKEIQLLVHNTANNVAKAFICETDFYPFAYGLIIFYAVCGFIIAYLWTFTTLPLILIRRRKEMEDIIDPKILDAVSAAASQEKVNNAESVNSEKATDRIINDPANPLSESLKACKDKVMEANKRPVLVPEDMQKKRWGGKAENNSRKIEATVTPNKSLNKFYDVVIRVTTTDISKPLTGFVALFVHDSFEFENNVVYGEVNANGYVEFPLTCYEAFTVGALCEDGTELELDLNEVKGFPEGFYWK